MSDRRTALLRARTPLIVGAATLAASAYVWAVDPGVPGHYPACPTKYLLGLDCPGCGGLRATHALLHGDVAAALDHNLLVAMLIPVAVIAWVVWLVRSWRGQEISPQRLLGRNYVRVSAVAVTAIVAFTVLRNVVPYLGSGIG